MLGLGFYALAITVMVAVMVGAGLRERGDVGVGGGDHQMHVQRHV